MAKNIWLIDNFTGGLSDQDDKGITGSFAWGEQLDFRSNPSVLTGVDAPAKNTTTIIEGLPKWMVQLGANIFAYDAGNKIYKAGSPWTKVYTNAQTGIGNGMAVMGSNLYYASNAKLGKDDGTFGAPTPTAQTFQDGSANSWHPMKVFGGAGGLCIGDGRYVAVLDYDGVTFYDGTTGGGSDLTLPLDVKVKCLEVFNDYLVIGTYKGTNSYDDNVAEIFFWDGTSTTYNFSLNLNESGVHAMISSPFGLIIQAGVRGNLYLYNGGSLVKIKQIPTLTQTGTTYNEIFPGAITNFKGLPHIGTAGVKTDTAGYTGVWSWGTNNKNYPYVMNYDYAISTGTQTGTTALIGCVFAANDTKLYVGWRDNATYGIDLINTTNKVATAKYRTLYFDGGVQFIEKMFKVFHFTFDQMAANETITVKYRKDSETSFTTIGAISGSGPDYLEVNRGIKCRRLQLQIEFTGTNNTLAKLRSIAAPYDVIEVI